MTLLDGTIGVYYAYIGNEARVFWNNLNILISQKSVFDRTYISPVSFPITTQGIDKRVDGEERKRKISIVGAECVSQKIRRLLIKYHNVQYDSFG